MLVHNAEVNVNHFASDGVDENVVCMSVSNAQNVPHDRVHCHAASVGQTSSHPLSGVRELLQEEESKGGVEVVCGVIRINSK